MNEATQHAWLSLLDGLANAFFTAQKADQDDLENLNFRDFKSSGKNSPPTTARANHSKSIQTVALKLRDFERSDSPTTRKLLEAFQGAYKSAESSRWKLDDVARTLSTCLIRISKNEVSFLNHGPPFPFLSQGLTSVDKEHGFLFELEGEQLKALFEAYVASVVIVKPMPAEELRSLVWLCNSISSLVSAKKAHLLPKVGRLDDKEAAAAHMEPAELAKARVLVAAMFQKLPANRSDFARTISKCALLQICNITCSDYTQNVSPCCLRMRQRGQGDPS